MHLSFENNKAITQYMTKNSSYSFSFLTASMNIHEMVKVAQSIVEEREIDATN